MNLKRLSCLILLIVIIATVNAKPPKDSKKKNVNKVTVKPKLKVKPKPSGARGRADAYDDDDKPLEPLLPPGDKLTPELKPETPDLTSGTSPVIGSGTCKGVCVPYYLCQNNTIVEDGSNLLDAKRDPTPKAELPLDAGKSGICGTFDACCTEPDKIVPGDLGFKYIHRCGIRQANGINRRILTSTGKGESEFGEWPWQAAILKMGDGEDPLFICGGVIIHEEYVLTVAHCVVNHLNNIPLLKVRLGEWDTQNNNEIFPHEDYKVADVIIHEGYRNASLWNDIALLKLDRKVKFQLNIDTICLPEVTDVFEGEKCVVTGWGKSAFQGGSYSQILKEVQLPVVPRDICLEGLRSTRLGKRFRLHEGFLCAGGNEGIDSCKGDGGGPLSCYRKDGTYALAGLVSWGIECGKPGVPGVYVDLRKYNQWIYANTHLDAKVFRPLKRI